MSEKIKLFYSQDNTEYLIKTIYQTELAHTVEYYEKLVPVWMRNWNGIKYYDSYESLVNDYLEELILINQDFLRAHIKERASVVPKFETVNDYRNHDVQREPEVRAVSSSNFRYNNAIPFYQLPKKRMHDPKGELRGRSLGQTAKPIRGMDEYLENVERNYRNFREVEY